MSKTTGPRVVCVGVVTLDALALVDSYPGADQRVVAQQIRFAGGGPAATAAVVLARQGVPVAFAGRVGADDAGEQAVAQLAAEGVDVSGVERTADVPTQVSCVVVTEESQSRAISTLKVPALSSLTPRAQELIGQAEWVHADHLGYAPVAAHFAGLTRRPKLSLDAGNPVAGLDDTALVDLFVPTVGSLCATTGGDDAPSAARQVLAAGTTTVVATDGSAGSHAWWYEAGDADPQHAFAPAMAGVRIVSTLGAGDVFHGGLLAAICRGENWADALRSANATAALSCRALDGRSAVPTLTELTTFLHPVAGSPAV
ncbi:MAG: PfkB family carbohydrate kinase [Propionicimonas sp.]